MIKKRSLNEPENSWSLWAMLDIKQIESFYHESLRPFKRNLLREYFQYKILEIIYSSKYGLGLTFMGGTAAHIVYGNNRFSEDLDFDNRSLDKIKFKDLAKRIKDKLKLEGYPVNVTCNFKGAYTVDVKIPKILFENGLSAHMDENLYIKLDAEPQHFACDDNNVILNKFDVFISIKTVPIDILLAQKIYAILNRKRPMGRDFYDAVYLLGKARPNQSYLKTKLGIGGMEELRNRLIAKCDGLDFKQLARDVEPFLFAPDDARKILMFKEYIAKIEF